ncbi:hypothetical protein NCAS_0E00820 [Naumovozyma castellii]|uniref:Pre-mRNA-splicing factor SYF2 n=1 Tax=Naumovozyma castellii TaxID=27288 RepID=G0VF87_NAUCA|nr:hypothetical protein NCAS_0E00820 [Naumovozyma castellii CBS 4309]CCC70152.1 hypothetical protein NCAS_0E00820 [Naumovozyma castellii CBS 4309]
MIDLEGYSRKLKELKRKAQDATIENRLLVDRESKDIESSGKPRVYNMQDDQDNQLETQEEDADDKVAKLMNYTLRQYEEWEKKQKDKKIKDDSSDMKQLAMFSYDKGVSNLNRFRTDKTTTEREVQIQVNSKTGKVNIQDEKKLVNDLAKNLTKTANKRYMVTKKKLDARSKDSSAEGYINERNKHFNEKLDRESRYGEEQN